MTKMDAIIPHKGACKCQVYGPSTCANIVAKQLFLVFVSKATAIGQPLEFFRLVANSFYNVKADLLPVPLEHDLLSALDNSIDANSLTTLINDYHQDWWNHMEDPGHNGVLSMTTLQHALNYHTKQHPYTAIPPVTTFLTSVSHIPDCLKYGLYQTFTTNAMIKLQNLLQFAEATQVSAHSHWKRDMCRAQGLCILNQAVLQKEADLVNEEPSVSVLASAN